MEIKSTYRVKIKVCKHKCVLNGHKMKEESSWRAPNLNGMPVYILYRPQRILCPEHGALNEFIPWADGTGQFTPAFNDEVAWFVCQMSKTAICEYLSINWRTVGNCIKASHARLEPDISQRIHDDVRRICVDETSYRIGYKYITVVYDMDKNRVIWVHENHGYEVFAEFCKLLTPEEREAIKQPPRRGMPLTGSDGNATLLSPTVVLFAVPIIFTVGIDRAAFPAGSVKGGGRVEKQYELVNVQ